METVKNNKKYLVNAVAKSNGWTKKKSKEALNAVVATIAEALKTEDVKIAKFGTLKRVELKARKGVNPKTGEKIDIAAKTTVRLRASKDLLVG